MPLIIDGNNLLHATMPPSLAGLDERRLCRLLPRSPWRGQRLVVVCDGGGPGRTFESPEPEVELIWSGPKRSADEVIGQLVAADTAPRRLVVVSSDHGLQRLVRRRGARVMECSQFISLLAGLQAPTDAAADEPEARQQPLSPDEVDRWLREFGFRDPHRPG